MTRDSIEWLERMARHSGLVDCEPMFRQIAAELRALRAEVERLRAAPVAVGDEWVRV
jgi:hypothetical protein